MIVVDTNIISYLYIQGERNQQAEQLLAADSGWCVPILWRSEFRSVLSQYLRKKILALDEALLILEQAEGLLHGHEHIVPSRLIMQLVNTSNCSSYDCEFVALARYLELPLITADKKILRGFPDTARSIDSYLG